MAEKGNTVMGLLIEVRCFGDVGAGLVRLEHHHPETEGRGEFVAEMEFFFSMRVTKMELMN